MPAHGDIITQAQTIETLGGAATRDVIEAGVLTKPSQIFFLFRLPVRAATPAALNTKAEQYAANIETIMGSDIIGGMAYVQVPDNAGLLHDDMDITVQTPTTDAFRILRWPLATLTWDAISGQALALVNEMYQAEQGG